jgi:hypothetical protein
MSADENLNPEIMEQMRQILASSEAKSAAFCSTKRRTWVMEKGSAKASLLKTSSNMWQSLADSLLVLSLHHLQASRLQWFATEGTVAMAHHKDKGSMGVLLDSKVTVNQTAMLLLQCEQALHKIR